MAEITTITVLENTKVGYSCMKSVTSGEKSSWRPRVVYLRRDWGGGREVQGQKKGGPRNNERDKMHK